jgi:hypothetical protein
MGTGITLDRLALALATALFAAALVASGAGAQVVVGDGSSTAERTNLLGSQLDRARWDGYQSTAGAVYPDSSKLHHQTRAAAQLQAAELERALVATEIESNRAATGVYADLVQPQGTQAVPDAFERAVNTRQAEIAARAARAGRQQPDGYQPQLRGQEQEPVSGGSDGSFDWGLFALLSVLGVAVVAACGAALIATRHRDRIAHS